MDIMHREKLRLPPNTTFDQDRFRHPRQRLSGCGPTTAAALAYYLTPSQAGSVPSETKTLGLMEDMWRAMPPTLLGLFNPYRFQRAFVTKMGTQGFHLKSQVVPVLGRTKDTKRIFELIQASLAQDIPVPFLHLYGQNPDVDTWHWMMLVGLEEGPYGRKATIFDNGRFFSTDLRAWMESFPALGAFVVIRCGDRTDRDVL